MYTKTQEYIYNRYKKQETQFIGTATSVIAEEIYNQRPKQFVSTIIVPVICIQINERRIRNTKPIAIKEYVKEEIFFAENENLAICGTGETKQEAIRDFMIHLIHFYEYYKAIDENQLIGKAIQLKKIYNELFIEESNAD